MQIKTMALGAGLFLSGLAALGFIPKTLKAPHGDDPKLDMQAGQGRILGLVPTNTPFNFVRLSLGIWALAASRDNVHAKTFLNVLGGIYATMAIMGLIPKSQTTFGLMPIYGANVLLHAGTAAAVSAMPWRSAFVDKVEA